MQILPFSRVLLHIGYCFLSFLVCYSPTCLYSHLFSCFLEEISKVFLKFMLCICAAEANTEACVMERFACAFFYIFHGLSLIAKSFICFELISVHSVT